MLEEDFLSWDKYFLIEYSAHTKCFPPSIFNLFRRYIVGSRGWILFHVLQHVRRQNLLFPDSETKASSRIFLERGIVIIAWFTNILCSARKPLSSRHTVAMDRMLKCWRTLIFIDTCHIIYIYCLHSFLYLSAEVLVYSLPQHTDFSMRR